MRRAPLLLIVGFLAVLPALPAQAKPGKASFNACALLKSAEVGSALGEPVQRKKGGKTKTGARYCNWFGQDPHVAQQTLNLIAARDSGKQRFKLYVTDFGLKTKVTGVGDGAATNSKHQALVAYKGKKFVYVSEGGWRGTPSLSSLSALAKKVLARL